MKIAFPHGEEYNTLLRDKLFKKEEPRLEWWDIARLEQVDIIDKAVIKLMNDLRLKDNQIAKIVLLSIKKARQDKIDNKCAYCDCSFPCSTSRSSDPREGRSGAKR